MTDEEIFLLIELNASRYATEKETLYQEFIKMDVFIKEHLKKNAVHKHFKTKKEMVKCMRSDFNPYSTFSFGRKNPSCIKK